ncbi:MULTISPECIES: DUF3631 domain-containing protein [unclassified Streptomyces]|uniref:DUF3631 domain-containing protein n=1 Tax=unclassified Streptomyces TaxID=2593676 RepID=UPI000B83C08A|nr:MULTISPECIES: DUF3631 domain-containing protein [unclassified Streptomyces]MYR94845.1 DUF3631 domain-containing protein [Streptomyces sp. SID4937]
MDDPAPSTPSLPVGAAAWPPVAVPGRPRPYEDGPSSEQHHLASASEGEEVLTSLREQILRYVVMPSEEASVAVTLWVAATHLQTAWQHAPRLAVVGPAKRCGKSRLLDVITESVHDPLITVNASAAAVFRSITDTPPTLLVDEADTLFGSAKVAEKNEEMRGLLNAGHQRNRPTLRVSGPNHEVSKFPTFAMAALAGIGDLPDTIMDRSVVIRMRRRMPGEKVAEFRTFRDTPPLHALRERLATWLGPLHASAMELTPAMPVEDRAADTWQPLVSVADLAGGMWPSLARNACRVMAKHEAEQDQDRSSLGIRLLADVRRAFASEGNPPALRTSRLLDILNQDAETPWPEYTANGLTPRGLQILLNEYGISSAPKRFHGNVQARGYTRRHFADAWARYCPEHAPEAATGD